MNTAAATRPARARLSTWPHDPSTAQLVLLDHHMVPTADDVDGWIAAAAGQGARTIRTGALFPDASPRFLDAGFTIAESLTLLTCGIGPIHAAAAGSDEPSGPRLRRLRRSQLDTAATIDGRSFDGSWSNDATTLGDIMDATPHHRSRAAFVDGRMVAFSISGRAGTSGYIQRLAVDPGARRHGLGRALVVDALTWMHRKGVDLAMVNTGTTNVAALELYRSLGFAAHPDPLLIVERPITS